MDTIKKAINIQESFNIFSKKYDEYETSIKKLQEYKNIIDNVLIEDDFYLPIKVDLVDISSLIRDIVTENSKQTVFIKEFSEKMNNNYRISDDEYKAFFDAILFSSKVVKLKNKVESFLINIKK